MKVAIAGFSLESVSFLTNLTSLEYFRRAELRGDDLVQRYRGTETVIGGFIEICEREGVEMVPIVRTSGGGAGSAADDAFATIATSLPMD
jgi:microcystin degradation protein MlrC